MNVILFVCWFGTIMGACAGAFFMSSVFGSATSAPQEAAGAAMAVALAVIPYVFTRALSEMADVSQRHAASKEVPKGEIVR